MNYNHHNISRLRGICIPAHSGIYMFLRNKGGFCQKCNASMPQAINQILNLDSEFELVLF